MRPSVVIIAPHDDVHALVVCNELRQLGYEPDLLDSAAFPEEWTLTDRISQYPGQCGQIVANGRRVSHSDIAGVWWRRPRRHDVSARVLSPPVRDFCVEESRSALQGWLLAAQGNVINPLDAEYAASRKPYQLRMATNCGLNVPDTLITNNPDDALDFTRRHSSCVFKSFTGTTWQFSDCRRFHDRYLAQLPLLCHAPVIFQEEIKKRLDVRVTIVDENVFAVSINPHHPEGRLDWRLDPGATIAAHVLPDDVAEALLALQKELGLRYGAVDLALADDGTYYFLENNPSGQFLFAEIHGGQPVAKAIAEALTAPSHSGRVPQLAAS